MKKIISFTIALILGFNTVSLSKNNSETSLSVLENRLCKTWYISKAFEIKTDKTKINKTEKTNGSTFTFNTDNSLIITNDIEKYSKGTWNELGENSISITMKGIELNFEIKELTNNNLYLIGKDKGKNDLEMHITFSSISTKSLEEKELSYNVLWSIIEKKEIKKQAESKNIELRTLRNTPQYVNAHRAANKTNDSENLILNNWKLKSIKIDNNGRVGSYSDMKLNFNFKTNNTLEIIESNISKAGTWGLINNEVLLTTNNKTTTFTISELNNSRLILKKTNKNFTIYYNLYK